MDKAESAERLNRIKRYEELFDKARILIRTTPETGRLADIISELEIYYTGPLWQQDLESDEMGLLPKDLKRGVLSQDGIYDLLCEYEDLTGE